MEDGLGEADRDESNAERSRERVKGRTEDDRKKRRMVSQRATRKFRLCWELREANSLQSESVVTGEHIIACKFRRKGTTKESEKCEEGESKTGLRRSIESR